jgi:hypothetical protein
VLTISRSEILLDLNKFQSMSTEIKCPNCGTVFEPTEAIRDQVRKELNLKAVDWEKKKNQEYLVKLEEERKKLTQTLEENLRKSISGDFEGKLRLLEQNNKDNEEKLRLARQKETEFLKKEQELKTQQEEMELTIQRKLQEEREKLTLDIRQLEEQRVANKENEYQLKLREMEKQLDDQKKLADEMRRKYEQGSMQLQGEAQELVLEEILQATFPYDSVEEVSKGVEGADCILIVRNKQGMECGKIIFESKRTKAWQNVWVDKLKSDMRKEKADLAVLVSQVFPRGMDCFGEKDGVWIASFREFIHLTTALRNALIRIDETRKSEENKGEKMQMLYNYLTGVEFRQNIEAIVEGFVSMKNSITRERVQMEKMWKEREKQLERVLLSTSGLYGSIKGIAGASVQDIPLLEANNSQEQAKEE